MSRLFGFPKKRLELVFQKVEKESLCFDALNDRIHLLTDVAQALLDSCDGSRTPTMLAERHGLEEEEVLSILQGLADAGLLEAGEKSEDLNRRGVLRGLTRAASAVVFASLLLPKPSHAVSSCGPCVDGTGGCLIMGNSCGFFGRSCCALDAGGCGCRTSCDPPDFGPC